MNKYPLKRMLAVRELREDQAARDLRNALDELATAVAFWEARKAEVVECRHFMRRKEMELAGATVGLKIETGAARGLQRELAAWRYRLEEAEAVMEAAAAAVETAQAHCEAARSAYQAKMKDKHKIENHRGIWQAQADKEAEAAEEDELEESANNNAKPKPAQ
ncbi:MAG: hypothetical protein JWP91_2135 [Fibrobacteres bacterium]|nr:hypothetical protein [Fibrobacterota bacterium]